MGPKKKKGKKAKKEKEKPPKTLKSEYLARIAERNAVLAAARSRIQKVEDVYFATEKRYEQTQEDMADIIKYLQHEIEENELEIATYDEKIEEYKAEIDKIDKYYLEIIAKMENDYEEKEKALQYQIQQNAAKLSAFEELKQQRDEYLRKKELLFRKMEELRNRHQQEIYEAEKQAIIKQANIQKQMETNLTKIAVDFTAATDIAIGETTNTLIRDNIALGNMLTCMQEVFEKARDSFYKAHEQEKQYRYYAELLDEEYRLVLQKYNSQVNDIESLLKSQEELHEKIKMSERLIKENRRLQRQIAEKECILKDKIAELHDLLKALSDKKDHFNSVKNAFNWLRKNVVNLEISLFEVAKKVKQAIDIENITHIIAESVEEIPVEGEKEEREEEEDLKEFKYKARVNAIEEIIEKFGLGLLFDSELPPTDVPSEFYLMSNQESTLSELGPVKLKEMGKGRIVY